ncbi:CDI1 [Auxenochlorella protothecoides x Auxenochlorella symbiontica]
MSHPYFPISAHLPGYVPLEVDFAYILATVGTAAVAVYAAIWLISGRVGLSRKERFIAGWLAVSGLIHIIIEGYVVLVPTFYKDPPGTFLSDVWKEYAHADSRYATRDAFVISMEAITAFFDGPGCLFVVWGLLHRASWRYTLLIIVSVAQIYGDVLYYATCYLEDFKHSRPEMRYFWIYFVVINAIWIVVPGYCIRHSWHAISRALHQSASKQKRR